MDAFLSLLLQRWLTFALRELPSKGWYPECQPDIVTASGEELRALVRDTKAVLDGQPAPTE